MAAPTVVVTDVAWIKQTVKFVGFLMHGELRAFPTSEAERARAWVVDTFNSDRP